MTNKEIHDTHCRGDIALRKGLKHHDEQAAIDKVKLNEQMKEICSTKNTGDATNELLILLINEIRDLRNELANANCVLGVRQHHNYRVLMSLNEIGNKMSNTLDTIQLLQ